MSLNSKDWKEEPRTWAADFQAALGAHARPSSKHSFPKLDWVLSVPCCGHHALDDRRQEGAPCPTGGTEKELHTPGRPYFPSLGTSTSGNQDEAPESLVLARPHALPPQLPPLLTSQPPPSSLWPPDLLFLWISYQKNSRAPNHVDISFSDPCPLPTPTPNFWNPLLYLSDHTANPQQNLYYPQPPQNHALHLNCN